MVRFRSGGLWRGRLGHQRGRLGHRRGRWLGQLPGLARRRFFHPVLLEQGLDLVGRLRRHRASSESGPRSEPFEFRCWSSRGHSARAPRSIDHPGESGSPSRRSERTADAGVPGISSVSEPLAFSSHHLISRGSIGPGQGGGPLWGKKMQSRYLELRRQVLPMADRVGRSPEFVVAVRQREFVRRPIGNRARPGPGRIMPRPTGRVARW